MFKFFKTIFATGGTVAAIPDALQVDGSVSFQEGYGTPYQLAKTDPTSRNIERDKMNYLFEAITAALQDWQTHGVPEFITTAENGGTPYSYSYGAMCRYSGDVYMSLKASNVDLPSVALSWYKVVPGGVASGVVGGSRNAAMSVTTASASATLTADEIVVKSALGGPAISLPSFNKTVNLATTGAGGMDTGSAPVSGFVALYAIYNPTTGVSALLGKSAATLQPEVYGGANMPSGYTHSALVAVVPTNGSSQIKAGLLRGRRWSFGNTAVLGTTTAGVDISLSVSTVVPVNARTIYGNMSTSVTSGAGMANIYATATNTAGGSLGYQTVSGYGTGSSVANGAFFLDLATPQTLYYSAGSSAATYFFAMGLSAYDI